MDTAWGTGGEHEPHMTGGSGHELATLGCSLRLGWMLHPLMGMGVGGSGTCVQLWEWITYLKTYENKKTPTLF